MNYGDIRIIDGVKYQLIDAGPNSLLARLDTRSYVTSCRHCAMYIEDRAACRFNQPEAAWDRAAWDRAACGINGAYVKYIEEGEQSCQPETSTS